MDRPKRSGMLAAIAVILPIALLAACDGGDGSPTPAPGASPTPVNQPPTITSSTSVTVREGQSAPFYNVVATDPEGAAVSYSISGGADAALFQIDARGALSFRGAPDFEAPADADRNNVYMISLVASDGSLTSATLSLQVSVTDDPGGPLRTRQVASGLGWARELYGLPDGSGRLLFFDGDPLVRVVNPIGGAVTATPFLDLAAENARVSGLAFSPGFPADRTVYVAVFKSTGATVELRRYRTVASDPTRIDASSYDSIATASTARLGIALAVSMGKMAFGADGQLYINFPLSNTRPLQYAPIDYALLRIDPTGDDFPADPLVNYRIPAGNIYGGSALCRSEIYAFNLGELNNLAIDRPTNTFWTLTYNANTEVNVIRPSQAGGNYGVNADPCGGIAALQSPTASYFIFRGMSDQTSDYLGGVAYRGPLEALQGQYIFGQYGIQPNSVLGPGPFKPPTLLTISASDARVNETSTVTVRSDLNPATGTGVYLQRIAQDGAGNVYILYSNGALYLVEGA